MVMEEVEHIPLSMTRLRACNPIAGTPCCNWDLGKKILEGLAAAGRQARRMVEQCGPEPQHRLPLPCHFGTIDGRQHLGRRPPGWARDGEAPLLVAPAPPHHGLEY